MTAGKAEPCAGYPSQTAAVTALMGERLDRHGIAARTGLQLSRVDTLMNLVRKRQAASTAAAEVWSAERLAKGERLIATTLSLISGALGVPLADLARQMQAQGWIKAAVDREAQASVDRDAEEQEQIELGAVSPRMASERLDSTTADPGTLQNLQIERSGGAPRKDARPIAPEPIADDAAIDEEMQRLIARFGVTARFKLHETDGQFLHQHERGLTRRPEFYWRNTAREVASLKLRNPQWRGLRPMEAR